MKKILLVRSSKSYLPQIDALIDYFNKRKVGLQMYDSAELGNISVNEFDGIWKFMGFELFNKPDIPIIHEYASLSTGSFPKMKNVCKKMFNLKPDLRIYLNQFVHEGLGFNDGIEYLYRDMGVDDVFFEYQNSFKKYDCVYIGAISKERGIHNLLDHFKMNCKNRSLLVIGRISDDIYENYSSCENIVFTGNLPYKDVPKYASEANYGINYMPDKYPYNFQTSTKLLEYLAMGLDVITTEYLWIHSFMKENNMKLITVNEKLEGMENALKQHESESRIKTDYNLEKFKWKYVIEHSGIEDKLLNIL